MLSTSDSSSAELEDFRDETTGAPSRPAALPADDCRVAIHHDIAGLAVAWVDLETRAHATPFQSYAWCRAWADACLSVGCHEMPCIVTVWRGDRLVLLWPLAERRLGPFRVLQSFAEPATQYGDALIEPGPESERWLRAAWDRIRSLKGLDAVILRRIRADAGIARLAASWGTLSTMRLDAAPFVDFGAPAGDGPARRRSGRTRNALQRHLRNLGMLGPVELRVAKGPAERRATILEAIGLKDAWLDRTARFSAGYSHRANAAFLERLAARDDFVAVRLCVGGTTAAIEAGLLRNGHYSSLVQSYDGRYAAHGPGRLLFWRLTEQASGLGIETFDFLAPAYPHKREWATGEVAVSDHVVVLRRRSRVIAFYLRHARPRLKSWIQRLRTGLHAVRKSGVGARPPQLRPVPPKYPR